MQTTEALSTRRMTAKAISVAWPAVMESFFVTLAGMIDTMMVSTLGPASVSAVGLTVQPKFIGLTLFFGINVAVSALVARRKGEQNREKANEILLTAGALSMALTVLVSILFTAFAPQLMQISGSNAETHEHYTIEFCGFGCLHHICKSYRYRIRHGIAIILYVIPIKQLSQAANLLQTSQHEMIGLVEYIIVNVLPCQRTLG